MKSSAQLLKTNDIVSYQDVKIPNVKNSNTLIFFFDKMREAIFFVDKMREAFAVQKLLSFCQQKISVYLAIKS